LAEARETSRIRRFIFRIETLRKITQFCFFLLFNAVIFGLAVSPVLLPVLQSLGTPQKTVGDAFTALQNMLYQVIFPWLPLASFILTAVILGRLTCGWVCPFGFVQDLLGFMKRRHKEVSLRTHRGMINIKYGVLLLVLFISGSLAASLAGGVGSGYSASLGVFAPAPFNALSPADTLFAVIPKMALDARYAIMEKPAWDILIDGIFSASLLLWVRLAILVIFLVLAIYIPRNWCQYVCPSGAGLAILSRFSFLGLKRDVVKCTKAGCRTCVEACPMKVRILELPWEKFTDPECIYCLKCVTACPTKALKPKFP